MRLTHVCLVTADLDRLNGFYTELLGYEPQVLTETYAEFQTDGGAILSMFSQEGQEQLAPGSTTPAANHSTMLEFEVADVDEVYRDLQSSADLTWVKEPSTQPWGTRSIYFRDPDGNLVNFYATQA